MGKLKGKKLDAAVSQLFTVYGANVQFNIMDLGKIMRDVVAAHEAGADMAGAMQAAVAKYRVSP